MRNPDCDHSQRTRQPRLSLSPPPQPSHHFQATTLAEAAASTTIPSPLDEAAVLPNDCALTYLEVGETPISRRGRGLQIAHILLRIFPRILNVRYWNPEWKTIAKAVQDFRRVGGFVRRSSKQPITLLTPPARRCNRSLRHQLEGDENAGKKAM